MIKLYMTLVLVISSTQIGLELKDGSLKKQVKDIEVAAKASTRINWRPISIFPSEARRFK